MLFLYFDQFILIRTKSYFYRMLNAASPVGIRMCEIEMIMSMLTVAVTMLMLMLLHILCQHTV